MTDEAEGHDTFVPEGAPSEDCSHERGTPEAQDWTRGWLRASRQYDREFARENRVLGVTVIVRPGVVKIEDQGR